MVRGLDVFRTHFQGAMDRFVLIGGVAVQLCFEEAGLEARATKDFDMVFRVESVDAAIMTRVWEFVRAGRYQTKQRSDGRREFFRFFKPEDATYPHMLEIFAGAPDELEIPDDQEIVPIAADDDISSLSAILVDEGYYELITTNTQEMGGLPIATPACLILLKARAWLDLSARKAAGERVDSKDIKKHRDDVFKLSALLVRGDAFEVSELVHDDLGEFLNRFPSDSEEWNAVTKSAESFGLDILPPAELLTFLREHFVRRPA